MKWDSDLYDNAQNFVSEYGKGLIEFIPKKNNLSILDLGCGTGDLTFEINSKFKCDIQGVDYSPEMINSAKAKYSTLNFSVCNATNLPFENKFDIIFSNAVFHWISDQNALHSSIYRALKENGILICEFGANENIEKISVAFKNALKMYNNDYVNPFYFPTVEQHSEILKNNGFTIEKIYDYDRPTTLPNGKLGLRQWVCQFFSSTLNSYDEVKKEEILISVENQLENDMFDGTNWIADYRRLRVIAHK